MKCVCNSCEQEAERNDSEAIPGTIAGDEVKVVLDDVEQYDKSPTEKEEETLLAPHVAVGLPSFQNPTECETAPAQSETLGDEKLTSPAVRFEEVGPGLLAAAC